MCPLLALRRVGPSLALVASTSMRMLAPDLWVHETSVRLLGMWSPLRTTVVRLPGGRLWVHSPVPLTPALKDELASIGSVAYLVAANNHHHRWFAEWQAAYPTADVFVAPGLARKVRTLGKHHALAEDTRPYWRGVLGHRFMSGAPMFSETVFFHEASRSLIVTDLVHNYTNLKPSGLLAWLVWPLFALFGFRGVCLAPPLRLPGVRRDPRAFAAALRAINAWNVSRIVVCHGAILEADAAGVLSALTARYLHT
jgi:hypothetical protein